MGSTHRSDAAAVYPSAAVPCSLVPCPLELQHTDLSAADCYSDCYADWTVVAVDYADWTVVADCYADWTAAAADQAAVVVAADDDDLQGLMDHVTNPDWCRQMVRHLAVKQLQGMRWGLHLAVAGSLVHQVPVQMRKQLMGLWVGLKGA